MQLLLEVLTFYFCMGLIGFSMNVSIFFKIFKDIGDAGFKISNSKKIDKNKDNNIRNNVLFLLFTPGVNILFAFVYLKRYLDNRFALLDNFLLDDMIEEMTEEEKTEYQKKPTAINSLLTPLKVELKQKEKNDEEAAVHNNNNNLQQSHNEQLAELDYPNQEITQDLESSIEDLEQKNIKIKIRIKKRK